MPFDGILPNPVAELLIAGRAKLARRGGWCQGKFREGDAYCMLGAIGLFTATTSLPSSAQARAHRLLQNAIGGVEVPLWNDNYRRRKKDVLAAYDRAIVLALERCDGFVDADAR